MPWNLLKRALRKPQFLPSADFLKKRVLLSMKSSRSTKIIGSNIRLRGAWLLWSKCNLSPETRDVTTNALTFYKER